MLENGDYTVWYRTPQGEGTGIVSLKDGELSGADSILTYGGSYTVEGDSFTVTLRTQRHAAGHESLLGVDDAEITLSGIASGRIASCRGLVDRSSKAMLEVTLVPIHNLERPAPIVYRPEDFHPERLPKAIGR